MKYLKKFSSVADANAQGVKSLDSPHASIIDGKEAVNMVDANSDKFVCLFDSNCNIEVSLGVPPSDEIWYITTDKQLCTLYSFCDFDYGESTREIGVGDGFPAIQGANGTLTIVSHIVDNGICKLKMSGTITKVTGIRDSTDPCGNSIFPQGRNTVLAISFPDNIISFGTHDGFGFGFGFPCKGLKKLKLVHLPNSLTRIETTYDFLSYYPCGAFYGCGNLKSINLPHGLKTIGANTFVKSGLTSIVIPNSVESIWPRAFSSEFLSSLVFQEGNDNCDLVIQDSTWSSKAWGSTFRLARSLKNITIPTRCTKIGSRAFARNSGLQQVIFTPNSRLKTIGNHAFFECGLRSITIPQSVTSIGTNAFNYNRDLSEVHCLSIVPPELGSFAFNHTGDNLSIYVPEEAVDSYKSATGWIQYADCIVGE